MGKDSHKDKKKDKKKKGSDSDSSSSSDDDHHKKDKKDKKDKKKKKKEYVPDTRPQPAPVPAPAKVHEPDREVFANKDVPKVPAVPVPYTPVLPLISSTVTDVKKPEEKKSDDVPKKSDDVKTPDISKLDINIPKPVDDAKALNAAIKGWGTDEAKLIDILAGRSPQAVQQIRKSYEAEFKGRGLIGDVKADCSGDFESCLVALCYSPAEYDAQLLLKSMKGLGTDEDVLSEVLATRTPAEIKEAAAEFAKISGGKGLLEWVKSETRGDLLKTYEGLINNPRTSSGDLDADVKALYNAGQNKIGTDEATFIRILTTNSREYCEKLYYAYAKAHGKSLAAVIINEMGGHLGRALAMLVEPVDLIFSTKIYQSMKGLGTNDTNLIRCIMSQRGRHIKKIGERFLMTYQKTISAFVASDCSGNYKRCLLKVLDFYDE